MQKSNLNSFKSNIVSHAFYSYRLAAKHGNLKELGLTLLPERFLEMNPKNDIAQFKLETLSFRTPIMEKLWQFQYMPKVGYITKLSLGGFPTSSWDARETTVTFLQLLSSHIQHLSLFYMKNEIDIKLLERMIEKMDGLKVIELRCHEVSTIRRLFKKKPLLVLIIWFDQRAPLEKELDYKYYSMETLQNDGIYKVARLRLNPGQSSPPNIIHSTIRSITNRFF